MVTSSLFGGGTMISKSWCVKRWKLKSNLYIEMPRLRRFRHEEAAAAKIQAALRKGKRKTKSRAGLNKTEKKEVKTMAEKAVNSGKESIYCHGWFIYDSAPTYGSFIQPLLQGTAILPNVEDPAQGAATCLVLQTGHNLTPNSVTLNNNMGGQCAFPLGGMRFPPVAINSEHGLRGDFAHFQSVQASLCIYANEINVGANVDECWAPLAFRVLHVKLKDKYLQDAGCLYNHMFLDTENDRTGLSAATSVKGLNVDLRVNTRAVKVLNDVRFKLNQCMRPSVIGGNIPGSIQFSAGAGGGASRPSYPSAKHLKLWCEKPKKKIRFSEISAADNEYEPLNYNYNEYIIVLCTRDQTFAGNYTAGQNTSRYWTVATNGITKVRNM